VAAVGDTLSVFGGQTQTGATATAVDDIQVVDPTLHTVSEAGHLPVALSGASAVSLGGQVFVIGGDTTSATGTAGPGSGAARTTSGTVWAFDASTGAVRSAGHLTVPVSLAGVAVVGQTAWVVGGESDGAPVTDVQSITYP
jgi:N-acetylneuraminic acid mutarotase